MNLDTAIGELIDELELTAESLRELANMPHAHESGYAAILYAEAMSKSLVAYRLRCMLKRTAPA